MVASIGQGNFAIQKAGGPYIPSHYQLCRPLSGIRGADIVKSAIVTVTVLLCCCLESDSGWPLYSTHAFKLDTVTISFLSCSKTKTLIRCASVSTDLIRCISM